MAEYYEFINSRYINLLQSPVKQYKFKLDLLTHHEQVIGEIINDISQTSKGQITVNKAQGVRRSCALNMINVNKKYLPSPNNPFWYNRKFKLYIGLCDTDNDDIYWFSQGVFVTQNANAQHNVVSINAVDKFGFLDGTLNTQICQVSTKVKAATTIGDLIRDTLMLDLGNGFPTDPIEPIIDTNLETKKTLNEIVLNVGQYIGELLIQVATSLGCDVYYDRMGRLKFSRTFNDDLPSWYIHKGAIWDFDDVHINYINPSVDFNYDGVNVVTVSSDNTEGVIYSYTAVNDNPVSPVAVSAIGYRGNRDEPVIYIPLGEVKNNDVCRQHAEYVLLQNTCMSVNVNFPTPILPHLDVDEAITVNDNYFDWEQRKFIIQSLSIPFGVGEMSISAINVQWLPTEAEGFKEGGIE